MKNIFQEFRDFAIKGNVLDLAVGVVSGGAFGRIVARLVSDIILPFLSLLTNNINLKNITIVLKQNLPGEIPVTLNYGLFIENIINFLIISFTIFLLVKAINGVRRRKEAQAVAIMPPREEKLLEEIRDILKLKKLQK